MTKIAHPLPHAHDRLGRFEGHMDTMAIVSALAITLTLLAALLTPGNLVPW
ncbi:MAG: hypothetical protein JWM33_414 [Caulobacteraceae bacterium]|nr:hypothetical protein [Caulobacteraceae bacterium]